MQEISALVGTNAEGSPLLSTSELQRLKKDKCEVLILHDRTSPTLFNLHDIDEYPGQSVNHDKGKPRKIKSVRSFDIRMAYSKSKVDAASLYDW